ncbi:MAG: glycosyltransferase [Lachnospiraceae bacterium]
MAEFRALRSQDERVHFISFSRNFGKESAMYAGLEAATGDYVAIMDVDLQDPPELLPGMLQSIEKEGYDCSATRRASYPEGGEPPIRQLFCPAVFTASSTPHPQDGNRGAGARDFRL